MVQSGQGPEGQMVPADWHVLCFIPTMRAGGAERVLAALMNECAAAGARVTVATYDDRERQSFYPLHDQISRSHIKVLGLRRLSRVLSFPWMLWRLRRIISLAKPDIIISFTDVMNIPVLAAARGLSVPIVVSERCHPGFRRFRAIRDFLRHRAYRRAGRIVVQTARVRDYFPSALQDKITIIPNMVHPAKTMARPGTQMANGRFRVIAVGSLNHDKGFDRLIKAFALISARHRLWDLVFFGDARDAYGDHLRAIASEAGLADCVRFAGLSTQIETELVRAHIMAFPSRNEGFPNALAEGVAHGLPVVAFSQVSGVEELVSDGVNGLLVTAGPGKIEALADALARLMSDAQLRAKLGAAGPAIVAKFSAPKIYQAWAETLRFADRSPDH